MPSPLEIEFHEAMLNVYRRAKDEAGYPANIFLAMVNDQGGVEAALTQEPRYHGIKLCPFVVADRLRINT